MSPRLRARLAPALVLAALAGVYLGTLATYDVTNDVQTTTLTSWRIAQTGAPWLDGYDYAQWSAGAPLWVGEAANGHLVGTRSPGPVAAGIPVYALLNLVGADGYSIAAGSVTAALLTTAALFLLVLALRERVGHGTAALAVVALGLATPVWSVSADALYPHTVTILGIAGMAWAAARERWWLVGLFGGVALWGRLHAVLIVAVLGIGLALARRRPRIAVSVGVVSALGLVLATLWSHWVYGTWSPAGGYSVSGYADRAMGSASVTDEVVNHLGLWVAPDRGILIWTPALALLAPAVWRSRSSLPDWSKWLAAGGIVYTLVQGQLNGFSGGSSFYGYRLTLELLVCSFPACVLALPQAGTFARRLLGPLLGLQFGAISIGALSQGGLLPESESWTNNSFIYALGVTPVLTAWPILTMLIGWLAGYLVERHLMGRRALAARTRSQPSVRGTSSTASDRPHHRHVTDSTVS